MQLKITFFIPIHTIFIPNFQNLLQKVLRKKQETITFVLDFSL